MSRLCWLGNLPWWVVPAARVAGAPSRAPTLSSGSAAPGQGLRHVQVAWIPAKGLGPGRRGRSERPGPDEQFSASTRCAHAPTGSFVAQLCLFPPSTFRFDKCRFYKNRTNTQ